MPEVLRAAELLIATGETGLAERVMTEFSHRCLRVGLEDCTALAAAALVGAIAEALVGPLAAPLNDAGLADHLAAFCLRAVGVAGAASVAGSGDTESAP